MAQFVGVKSHTILLLDRNVNGKSERTWTSHPSFDAAVDQVIKAFENQLGDMNEKSTTIQVLSINWLKLMLF